MAGLDGGAVVDALAEIPWKRDALRIIPADPEAGTQERAVHSFFEGTLATTVWNVKERRWHAGAPGATRANYEAAIVKVLEHMAAEHPELKEISSPDTLDALGLVARRGPGRPRKAPKASERK